MAAEDVGQVSMSQVQELWLSLAERRWRSLVIVPVDSGPLAKDLARALGTVGAQFSEAPVSVLAMRGPEDESRPAGAGAPPPTGKDIVARLRTVGEGASVGQLIVAAQPVFVDPLSVLVARAAEVVVLCVEKARSRTADVRRTQALIGAKWIAGCLVVEG